MNFQIQNFKYHIEIVKKTLGNRMVWDWFSKQENENINQDEILLTIEKENYAISRKEQPELYSSVENTCKQLGIPKLCKLFQSINKADNNAQIIELDDQLVILFSGETLNLLTPQEIKSILHHELGHIYFNKQEDGQFEITNRIINTFANNNDNQKTYTNTCRNFQLYLELFCDRVSLQISQNSDDLISALIKIHTGLKEVSVKNYISQAENVIIHNKTASTEEIHPELFIRCYALANANNDKLDIILNSHILGSIDVENLDILDQNKLQNLTQNMIQHYIQPVWTNIPEIDDLVKIYFPHLNKDQRYNFQYNNLNLHENTKQYLSYVLLDFCLANQELKDELLWQGKLVSEIFQIDANFTSILKKELKLSQKEIDAQLIKSKEEFTILETNL